jgi:hypothetical protein
MGSSPAFSKYAKGETGGYAKANAWKKRMNAAAGGRGAGRGGANSSREVMGSDDPEASARRAGEAGVRGEQAGTEGDQGARDGGCGRRGWAARRAQEEPREG